VTAIPVPDPFAEQSPGTDFYRLRREGIGHIAESSGDLWTDYNVHDPGITILEALAYAITDLSYRAGFSVEDLLASAPSASALDAGDGPYPDQAYFSARQILTVNPTTPADFRRLLIDAEAVRNAWVRDGSARCSPHACTPTFSAWCEDGELTLSWDSSQRRDDKTQVLSVEPRGLYRVLLELEADPELGELNDRKITRRRGIRGEFGRLRFLTMELRFPAFGAAREADRLALALAGEGSLTITAERLTRTTTGTALVDDEVRRHWNDIFYVDLRVEVNGGATILIENASLRLYGDGSVRRATTVADLLGWLSDPTGSGFVEPYRAKLTKTDAAIQAARGILEAHRNLDEDWGCIELVELVEIAVCAQIEVDPAADIELVQARVWHTIEQHLDPPVRFASLPELTSGGLTTDAVFNGPALANGFLTDAVLRETDLRSQLRTSDLLDLLMEIDGVLAVTGTLLTAYDAAGVAIAGIADPDWTSDGTAVFDPARTSAAWFLALPGDRRVRLHRGLSSFSFTSDGLPFAPRLDEAEDTLVQLRGAAARPKIRAGELDVTPPRGERRDLETFEPVQHGFPMTYGIGPAGLPSTASAARRAQAKQLKAYLMVFEQLLLKAHAQLAHAPELFSLSRDVEHTYFAGDLVSVFPGDPESQGGIGFATVAADTLTPAAVAQLAETPSEFLERRSRFLDHLLARFGESFRDHPMTYTDPRGRAKSIVDLIRDKLAFLRAVPRISRDRGKGFDRLVSPTDPDNTPGMQQRVHLLLGLPDWTMVYRARRSTGAAGYQHTLTLDELGEPILSFTLPDSVGTALVAVLAENGLDAGAKPWTIEGVDGSLTLETTADGRTSSVALLGAGAGAAAVALGSELARTQRALLATAILRERWGMNRLGGAWRVNLHDADGARVGRSIQLFTSRQRAGGFLTLAASWAAHKRSILVEHLLLRPKFPGDALYPACTTGACGDGVCDSCGDEDPYSFRLTYVMPGWTPPFADDMTMRGFAERTIAEQTPSHLLVKTCWVGDDGYLRDPCDPVVDRIAEVLRRHLPGDGDECACASRLHEAFATAFEAWFAGGAVAVRRPGAVRSEVAVGLAGVDVRALPCTGGVDEDGERAVREVVVDYFTDLALRGRQFERFETAWTAWAEADAAIDWTAEHLLDAVVETLAAGATAPGATHEAIRACATRLLSEFGIAFRQWMDAGLDAGAALEDFPPFLGTTLTPCASLGADDAVGEAVKDLLLERYARYAEVSFRLSQLDDVLGGLRNVYPPATLHDCDDGSDFNPVRLGRTALGSN
jgi:hypothetical protein